MAAVDDAADNRTGGLPVKFDALKNKLARIESALAALRPERKILRVIVDQGADPEEKMQSALAEHVACYPEDAGRTVSDFDWTTRVVLPDPRQPPAASDCR
jgi:hypothetical protein